MDLNRALVTSQVADAAAAGAALLSMLKVMTFQAGEVTVQVSFSLGSEYGLISSGAAAGSATLSVGRALGLSPAYAAIFDRAVSLAIVRAVEFAAGGLTEEVSLALAQSFGLTMDSAAQVLAQQSMGKSLGQTGEGLAEAGASSTEGRFASVVPGGTAAALGAWDADRSAAVDVGAVAFAMAEWFGLVMQAITATGGAQAGSDLILAVYLALAAMAGTQLEVTVSLSRSGDMALESVATGGARVTLPVAKAAATGASAQALAGATLSTQRVLDLLATAAALTGVSYEIIRIVQISGDTVEVVVYSGLRTRYIMRENRTFEVAAESRTRLVPAENRVLTA